MKKAGKRLLSYLLVLAMLMSLYTPVYGADASVSAGAGTQAVDEKQQTGQKEPAAEEGIMKRRVRTKKMKSRTMRILQMQMMCRRIQK